MLVITLIIIIVTVTAITSIVTTVVIAGGTKLLLLHIYTSQLNHASSPTKPPQNLLLPSSQACRPTLGTQDPSLFKGQT